MSQPTVYVGAQHRPSRDSFVCALDAATGSPLWRCPLQDVSPSLPVATPTEVYFSASSGYVYALLANEGTLLWQQQVHQQFPSPPVIAEGSLYVTTQDAILALQITDGSIQWQYSVAGLMPIKPVIAGDRTYIRLKDGSIAALNASSGSLLWRMTGRGDRLTSMAATPDVVYLTAPGEDLSALRASDGSPLWRQPLCYVNLQDPIIDNGVLYLNTGDQLQARRGNDGSLLWSQRSPRGTRSLATMDGLLFTSQGRETTAEIAALRTSDGSLAWNWQCAFNQGGVTAPVIAYGAVYVGIGASGGLYALSGIDGHVLWHTLDDRGVTTAAVSERRASA